MKALCTGLHLRSKSGNKGNLLTGFSRGSQVIITDTAVAFTTTFNSHILTRRKSNLKSKSWLNEPDAHLDQVDLMLGAEGLYQLDVHGLVTVGSQDAEMGLTSAKTNV